ncbi:MAG: hypothetical protein BWY79_01277 [Actinobacteria bacterium ADurb.Bin444]|nr:MAG: hypothetical protein BWY79_01277 [Actinobacteria bacterium ADurb.Bin444]
MLGLGTAPQESLWEAVSGLMQSITALPVGGLMREQHVLSGQRFQQSLNLGGGHIRSRCHFVGRDHRERHYTVGEKERHAGLVFSNVLLQDLNQVFPERQTHPQSRQVPCQTMKHVIDNVGR